MPRKAPIGRPDARSHGSAECALKIFSSPFRPLNARTGREVLQYEGMSDGPAMTITLPDRRCTAPPRIVQLCTASYSGIEWVRFHCAPRSRKPTSRRTKVKAHLISVVCVCVVLAGTATASTVHVDWNGGGDHLTIQEGVTAASSGDSVLVAPGTYTGPQNRDILFGGKDVYLVSEAGAELTIIDCQHAGRAFVLAGSEPPTTTIEGFTVLNGVAPSTGETAGWGGAIYCANSAPAITRLPVRELQRHQRRCRVCRDLRHHGHRVVRVC